MADLLFLDPNKHQYIVLSRRGNPVGRFSNLACAAQSVVSKSKGGAVIVPDGKVLDRDECKKILDSWRTVKEYSKRAPTGMVETMSKNMEDVCVCGHKRHQHFGKVGGRECLVTGCSCMGFARNSPIKQLDTSMVA